MTTELHPNDEPLSYADPYTRLAWYKSQLERAERERDELRSPSYENALSRWVERAERAEARLAKADKLAEALRYIVGDDIAGMEAHLRPEEVATRALAAWES